LSQGMQSVLHGLAVFIGASCDTVHGAVLQNGQEITFS
jgi:hypothetical protein